MIYLDRVVELVYLTAHPCENLSLNDQHFSLFIWTWGKFIDRLHISRTCTKFFSKQNDTCNDWKWFKAIFWQVQSQSAQNLFYMMNHCSHFEPRLMFFVFTTILSSSWLNIIDMPYIIEYCGAIILVYCVVEKEKKFVGE